MNVKPYVPIKAVVRYPGAKWSIASWIVSFFPQHRTYIEPFFGSGAVLFTKPPSEHEVINDTYGAVVNLFRMIREHGEELARLIAATPWSRAEFAASYIAADEPMEDARRFLVRLWQGYGSRIREHNGWRNRKHADGPDQTLTWDHLPLRLQQAMMRLKRVEIEQKPALEVIRRFSDDPDCLIYADPPYVLSTRHMRKHYIDEMTDTDHLELLDALETHTGPVVLSGYPSALYDKRLSRWQRVTTQAMTNSGAKRTEVLWLNPEAVRKRQLRLL
jgi:DNA adenine methylase